MLQSVKPKLQINMYLRMSNFLIHVIYKKCKLKKKSAARKKRTFLFFLQNEIDNVNSKSDTLYCNEHLFQSSKNENG